MNSVVYSLDIACGDHLGPDLNSVLNGVHNERTCRVAPTRRVGRTRRMPWGRWRWRVARSRHGHQREPERRTHLDEPGEQQGHTGANGGFLGTDEPAKALAWGSASKPATATAASWARPTS